jgi:hypothetical protein
MEFVAVQNDPYTRDLPFSSAMTPKPVADVIAILVTFVQSGRKQPAALRAASNGR